MQAMPGIASAAKKRLRQSDGTGLKCILDIEQSFVRRIFPYVASDFILVAFFIHFIYAYLSICTFYGPNLKTGFARIF
jgi:hypothetical protein